MIVSTFTLAPTSIYEWKEFGIFIGGLAFFPNLYIDMCSPTTYGEEAMGVEGITITAESWIGTNGTHSEEKTLSTTEKPAIAMIKWCLSFGPTPLHPLPNDGCVPLSVWDSDVKGTATFVKVPESTKQHSFYRKHRRTKQKFTKSTKYRSPLNADRAPKRT